MLGYADMRGNVIAAMIVLAFGVIAWRFIRDAQPRKRRLPVVPMIALACGPIIAFVYYVLDVLWFSRGEEILFREYVSEFTSIMTIGLIGGLVGAIGFWLGSFVPLHRGRYNDERLAQTEHVPQNEPEQ